MTLPTLPRRRRTRWRQAVAPRPAASSHTPEPALAILAGVLAVAVLGALMWSLQPHRRSTGEQTELYNVDRVSKSEGRMRCRRTIPAAAGAASPFPNWAAAGRSWPGYREVAATGDGCLRGPGHDPNDALRKEAEAAAASSVFFRSGGQNAAPVAQTQVAAAPGFAAMRRLTCWRPGRPPRRPNLLTRQRCKTGKTRKRLS